MQAPKEQQDSHPRVFVSYSQSGHKEAVLDFVDRLRHDGLDAIIDEYDLELGHDVNQFMERTATDTSLTRVLIMCDRSYTEKANARTGGVGKEAVIISEEVYSKNDPGKFIPVILEKDGNGVAYRPAFLKSAFFIDLSEDRLFDVNYERLLRNLFGRPSRKKPDLGTPPEYLLSDTSPTYPGLARILRGLQAPDVPVSRKRILLRDARVEINDALWSLSCGDWSERPLLDKIAQTKPIRDFCLKAVQEVLDADAVDVRDVGDFVQALYNGFPIVSGTVYEPSKLEYLDFFLSDLFIGITSYLLETQQFASLHKLLFRTYFLRPSPFYFSQEEPRPFAYFQQCLEQVEKEGRKQSKFQRRYSVTGDLLVERELRPFWTSKQIHNADLFLFQMGTFMNRDTPEESPIWYPMTMANYQYERPVIWSRLVSREVCKKVLPLFGLKTIEELKGELLKTAETSRKMKWGGGSALAIGGIPGIADCIEIDKIGTLM